MSGCRLASESPWESRLAWADGRQAPAVAPRRFDASTERPQRSSVPVSPSATLPFATADSPRLAVGILSTYPPTPCGLATFSAALSNGLRAHGVDVRVVRV